MQVIDTRLASVVATAVSFSRSAELSAEMQRLFPGVKLNSEGQRLAGKTLVDFVGAADALVVGLEKIDENFLDQCPGLRFIAKYGVGLDNIDVDACRIRGVTIGWTGGINRLAVAEMTLGYMLSLCRNLCATSALLKQGRWEKDGGTQLSGKTVGVIGAGHIGREVIRLLAPFGCRILVNDIVDIGPYCTEQRLIDATKHEIFTSADIVTIHTPLTTLTHHLVNGDSLRLMKSSAFIINTARGGIVKSVDIVNALKDGTIAGAALDVYEEEPPTNRELLGLPNLICTPHIGGNSAEAVYAMGMSAIGHLRDYYGLGE